MKKLFLLSVLIAQTSSLYCSQSPKRTAITIRNQTDTQKPAFPIFIDYLKPVSELVSMLSTIMKTDQANITIGVISPQSKLHIALNKHSTVGGVVKKYGYRSFYYVINIQKPYDNKIIGIGDNL